MEPQPGRCAASREKLSWSTTYEMCLVMPIDVSCLAADTVPHQPSSSTTAKAASRTCSTETTCAWPEALAVVRLNAHRVSVAPTS
jgi:hypothetical protein